MPERRPPAGMAGFSMVEMLIAMAFTLVLMAGMATVFKASVNTFYTAGEKLSSVRRNRSSVDLLYDDLNAAGMYLSDITAAPLLGTTNPGFYVLPNTLIGAVDNPDDPDLKATSTADELYFYYDQPLPFEGTLVASVVPPRSAAEIVNDQLVDTSKGAMTTADRTYTIECRDAAYAAQVKTGQSMIFKDYFQVFSLGSVVPSGTKVTITLGGVDPSLLPGGSPTTGTPTGVEMASITGTGDTAAASKVRHLTNSGVVFFTPGQMVRYSIRTIVLDPQNLLGTPCLVRDQGDYTAAGFVADPARQQVITENVLNFKVYLSADAGRTWAGQNVTATGFQDGWVDGIQAALDVQLAEVGRPDFTTTKGNPNWFRSIPTLVRVDITTRTAVKRAEYVDPALYPDPATRPAKDSKKTTQSLVIVPRHFGLPLK